MTVSVAWSHVISPFVVVCFLQSVRRGRGTGKRMTITTVMRTRSSTGPAPVSGWASLVVSV